MDTEKIICIGVLDKEHKGCIRYFIEKLLIKYGYRLYYRNEKGNINCFHNYLKRLVIIDLDKKNLAGFISLGIELDIIIIDELETRYSLDFLGDAFSKCKYFIINSDNENWTALGTGDIDGVVLTYGFNTKATITLSSYNTDSNVKANICLQREVITIDQDKIEPFEFTVEIGAEKKDNTYSLIGAMALFLILGHKDENIQINDKEYKR